MTERVRVATVTATFTAGGIAGVAGIAFAVLVGCGSDPAPEKIATITFACTVGDCVPALVDAGDAGDSGAETGASADSAADAHVTDVTDI